MRYVSRAQHADDSVAQALRDVGQLHGRAAKLPQVRSALFSAKLPWGAKQHCASVQSISHSEPHTASADTPSRLGAFTFKD